MIRYALENIIADWCMDSLCFDTVFYRDDVEISRTQVQLHKSHFKPLIREILLAQREFKRLDDGLEEYQRLSQEIQPYESENILPEL